MRDHVRLTTQPFDAPPTQSHIEQLIEHLGEQGCRSGNATPKLVRALGEPASAPPDPAFAKQSMSARSSACPLMTSYCRRRKPDECHR